MAYKELQRKVNKSASSSPSPYSSSFVSSNRFIPNSAMLAILQGDSEVQSPNRTGLPDAMKERFERLTGLPLDNVRVHRNSDMPAQLDAKAYAQGNEIHLGTNSLERTPINDDGSGGEYRTLNDYQRPPSQIPFFKQKNPAKLFANISAYIFEPGREKCQSSYKSTMCKKCNKGNYPKTSRCAHCDSKI